MSFSAQLAESDKWKPLNICDIWLLWGILGGGTLGVDHPAWVSVWGYPAIIQHEKGGSILGLWVFLFPTPGVWAGLNGSLWVFTEKSFNINIDFLTSQYIMRIKTLLINSNALSSIQTHIFYFLCESVCVSMGDLRKQLWFIGRPREIQIRQTTNAFSSAKHSHTQTHKLPQHSHRPFQNKTAAHAFPAASARLHHLCS